LTFESIFDIIRFQGRFYLESCFACFFKQNLHNYPPKNICNVL